MVTSATSVSISQTTDGGSDPPQPASDTMKELNVDGSYRCEFFQKRSRVRLTMCT